MEHTYKNNVYSDEITTIKYTIGDQVYMDDSTWLANKKETLEQILEIADQFFTLNNIKVNKDKSELLVSSPSYNTSQPISIKFGHENISLLPKNYTEVARILGVWINLDGSKKFVIKQMKDEVISFRNTIKYKWITDKQMLYLWNMVIIPRLEYRSQLTVFTKDEAANITSPFKRFFKRKLNLAATAPNAILSNNLIYQYRDLYEVQLQSKITNFFIQINDQNLMGQLTNLRLLTIQSKECLHVTPLLFWPLEKLNNKQKKSFFYSMLHLLKTHHFAVDSHISNNNKILDGKTNIRLFFKKTFIQSP